MSERVDVVVLGMGIAGELIAGELADTGLSVVGIDHLLVGGECPYWGCVPTKMIVRAANALAEARRVNKIAGAATVEPSWEPVARRIRDDATANWDDREAVERFEARGGRFVRGTGRLVGPHAVGVGDAVFEASRAVVVATGSAAVIPPIPGLDTVDYWTNREVVMAKELPDSLLVLGGGAIGLELAQALQRFGVAVSIVEALDRLLPPEEPEVSALVEEVLRAEGADVHTGVKASGVRRADGGIALGLDNGRELVGERLLVATGRRADLAALGVANAGLDEKARWIAVDGRMRAGDGLWAVGDVTGVGLFTHIGVYQGRIALDDILGREPTPADYRALPRVTFTDPEVGSVGKNEAAARDEGIRVRVGTATVPSSARGWIHGIGNEGLIKLVEDADRGVLVGATSVGPAGGEVLSMLTLAVHAEVPTTELRRMIYAYPTFHRAVEDALRDLADPG